MRHVVLVDVVLGIELNHKDYTRKIIELVSTCLEKWYCMKRLLSQTHQIAANTVVDDSLLGYVSQIQINFINSYSW